MLIEQIDGIDLEPLERALHHLFDVLWPTVQPSQTSLRLGINFPPELGGDHHLPTEGSEGFAHEFFVYVRAIDFGRVEERDAAFNGSVQKRVISCLSLGGP